MRLSARLAVCLCVCPLWSLLVSPVSSITITTVYAGKKKFKAYNLGIPFVPTLVKVKPNKLHLTVRQNRYIRPPSFKIEGSVPLKVPTIIMQRPDPYAPVQEININTDLHLGGKGQNKAQAYIGGEQHYAASEPNGQMGEADGQGHHEAQGGDNQQYQAQGGDNQQHQEGGEQTLTQYFEDKMPAQMESAPPGMMYPVPPEMSFPMSPVDASAMSFPPPPPYSNMFPLVEHNHIPTFDAGQLFHQQQQQQFLSKRQQPEAHQHHRIHKRSTNLHEPYHHHLNPQLGHLRQVSFPPPPPPPMALSPQGFPFFLPPPPLPGNNRFLPPPSKQHYRPAAPVFYMARRSSVGMNQLAHLPPPSFSSNVSPLPVHVPHPPTPMALDDPSSLPTEGLESVSIPSESSVPSPGSKRNQVPMKINIGEHYNPNMVYIDESLVPNIDELHGMPLELSGSPSANQPAASDQTVSPTISLDSVSTSQEGDAVDTPQPEESSNYKYHKYYHPKVYDDGPDDFRLSFSFSGPHGGPSVYKGYGDNMDQYNKQLNKYHSKDMLPPGLTPKQIHQYYVSHTFTDQLPIYGRSKSIKMTRSGLMKWLLG